MGFAAGNQRLINALTRMKSYLDYGAFTPIQVAAATALTGPQDCVDQIRALYKERRDVLIKGLASAGWDMPSPEGSMFAWAPMPPRYARLGSVEFSKLLLERAKVAVAPGLGFGEYGEGFVRIALVENTHRLRQAIRNIRGFHAGRVECRRTGAVRNGCSMTRPLSVGIAGLGTVGGGVLKLLRDNADIVTARAGRPIAVTAVSARDRSKDRGVAVTGLRWYDDPVGAGDRSRRGRGGGADWRLGRSGAGAGGGHHRRRQTAGDREQGAAGGAWRGAGSFRPRNAA